MGIALGKLVTRTDEGGDRRGRLRPRKARDVVAWHGSIHALEQRLLLDERQDKVEERVALETTADPLLGVPRREHPASIVEGDRPKGHLPEIILTGRPPGCLAGALDCR